MNVLVTGCTGFIAKDLIKTLHKKVGYYVLGSSRRHVSSAESKVVVVGEVGPLTDWSPVLSKIDIVIHTAARAHILNETSVNPIEEFRRTNVDGTLNLAYQAAAAGVRRLIYISSIGVNGLHTLPGRQFSETDQPHPHNAYATSKFEAEQGLLKIAFETGLEIVIIRPPLVYGYNAPGNFDALLRAVRIGWPIPLGGLHNKRSFVALDNLIDFIITCMQHPAAVNQIFLVSDGNDLSTSELLCGMASAMGVKPRMISVPASIIKTCAWLLGKSDIAQRLCGNLQVDISKAKLLLSWVPPISVKEGLRRAVQNHT